MAKSSGGSIPAVLSGLCGSQKQGTGFLRKSPRSPKTSAWQPVWMVEGAGHGGRASVMPGVGLSWEEQQYKAKDISSGSRDTQR